MLYDPQLDNRLSQRAHAAQGQKLAPTLSSVTAETHKVKQDTLDFKHLLQELASSDFVQQMKHLRHNIIE